LVTHEPRNVHGSERERDEADEPREIRALSIVATPTEAAADHDHGRNSVLTDISGVCSAGVTDQTT